MHLLTLGLPSCLSRIFAAFLAVSATTGCIGSGLAEGESGDDLAILQVIGQCDETFAADAMAALRQVGVAASRNKVDKQIIDAISYISSRNPNIYSVKSVCFFDFIDPGAVRPYGGSVVYFPTYYEVWVLPADKTEDARLCAGANPDGWDAGSLTDIAYPRSAVVPEGYGRAGPAQRERFRPVCRSEKENYVGYL